MPRRLGEARALLGEQEVGEGLAIEVFGMSGSRCLERLLCPGHMVMMRSLLPVRVRLPVGKISRIS